MSSQNASPQAPLEARTPQRRRGRKRVADLMEAGAQIFVEKGYDAATMTEIASRADASIGSLYQFFPSKTLLAEAIHVEALEALAIEMDDLKQTLTGQESAASIADSLIGRLLDFMQEHPALLVMAERRDIDPARKARTRKAMRDQIAGLLALGRPAIASEQLQTMAIVVLAVMRSAMTLLAEKTLASPNQVVAELRRMLHRHLEAAAEAH
jgi:AcrR family transcriptional regulator